MGFHVAVALTPVSFCSTRLVWVGGTLQTAERFVCGELLSVFSSPTVPVEHHLSP